MPTFHLYFLFSILFPISVLTAGFDFFRAKTIKIDRIVGRCAEHPNALITMDNIRLMKFKRVYTFNIKINIRDNVTNDMTLDVMGSRCKSKDSPDTCEHYKTIHLTRLCDKMDREKQPWTPLMDKTHPKIHCPLQKGIYQVINGTFDGNAFANLPIEDWYWKVVAQTRELVTNRLLLCLHMEAQIVPV